MVHSENCHIVIPCRILIIPRFLLCIRVLRNPHLLVLVLLVLVLLMLVLLVHVVLVQHSFLHVSVMNVIARCVIIRLLFTTDGPLCVCKWCIKYYIYLLTLFRYYSILLLD